MKGIFFVKIFIYKWKCKIKVNVHHQYHHCSITCINWWIQTTFYPFHLSQFWDVWIKLLDITFNHESILWLIAVVILRNVSTTYCPILYTPHLQLLFFAWKFRDYFSNIIPNINHSVASSCINIFYICDLISFYLLPSSPLW